MPEWDFKGYAFDLPNTRSARLKAKARQRQLERFIVMYRSKYGEPGRVTLRKVNGLTLEGIPLEADPHTPPEHVFIWKEKPGCASS